MANKPKPKLRKSTVKPVDERLTEKLANRLGFYRDVETGLLHANFAAFDQSAYDNLNG